MTYSLILAANNDTEFLEIPVLPEIMEVESPAGVETVNVHKLGAVSLGEGSDVKTISFESFFPVDNTRFATSSNVLTPSEYIDTIEKWKGAAGAVQAPIRLTYSGGSFEINDLFIISDFRYEEGFGTRDVPYSIEFSEYKNIAPKFIKILPPPPPPKKPAAPKPAPPKKPVAVKKDVPARQNQAVRPVTYSLVKGDSLWKIAQKYTGKGSNYPALQKLNGIKNSELRRLPIGLKLKIPPEWVEK